MTASARVFEVLRKAIYKIRPTRVRVYSHADDISEMTENRYTFENDTLASFFSAAIRLANEVKIVQLLTSNDKLVTEYIRTETGWDEKQYL